MYNRSVFFLPLRDENPSYGLPIVVLLLIAINVYAFYLEITFSGGMEAAVFTWGAIPKELVTFRDFPPATGLPVYLNIFTSMFMHGGLMHLIGNMWFLWLFGDNCEYVMGRLGFAGFYLLCGIAATIAQVVLSPLSDVPMVGASGAIAGVMGAYLVYYPAARIYSLMWLFVFVRFVYIPAALFLIVWIVFQIWSAMGDQLTGGGIAYGAHIGGFAAGLLLAKAFMARKSPPRGKHYGWTRRIYDFD
ncbi:MAG: rhomboid family intramembrane serine protease [bacterium]|jgi:membrane associated rhomboid family serine protease